MRLDPEWYRRAVFYEVMVRSYVDSNGDGSGDLGGLISRLDYLQWLGVDALWLPPIYQSPLRDGGYDASDFRSIPARIRNRRGIPRAGPARPRAEHADRHGLSAHNHTSDAHEWFQQSRSDPDGPYGDYYMWSDSAEKYPNVRVIFVDTEESNWAFDSVRRQFYFHRFFSHQPDLNFENAAVREEVLGIIRFWLDMGVDGIRLDAVPYLFVSDDGNGEGEPATHQFLREMRAMVDRDYPGRILIAEANQWPQEVVSFFGTEEEPECHMAFDFPVMPRIFYSLRAQQSGELIRILSETTDVPPARAGASSFAITMSSHSRWSRRSTARPCTAGTPTTRDALEHRHPPKARPAARQFRAELELAHALLFALKGSPFLYYGDEIGMGDNIWLPDRDSSRTPMQWNPDRNAGFSSADPGKLYSPVVQSLVYNYALVNVESQLAQSRSLLHWIRNVVHVRKAQSGVRARLAHHGADQPRVRAGVHPRIRGIGHPIRRRAGAHLVRLQFLPQPGLGRDPGRGHRRVTAVGPVRRRHVSPGRRGRFAHADARDAGLLLAAHRRRAVVTPRAGLSFARPLRLAVARRS